MTKTALVLLALIAPTFIVSPASADIYIHIGNDGVMSFTNGSPPFAAHRQTVLNISP